MSEGSAPATGGARWWRLALAVAVGIGLLAVAATAGLAAALVWWLPTDQPRVARSETLAMRDVERALQVARQHDPRRAIPGVTRTLRLSPHEAEVLLNHAAARLRPGHWRVQVGAERLEVRGSVQAPAWAARRWIDLELLARQSAGLPRLEALRVGPWEVPVPLATWLLEQAAERAGLGTAGSGAAVTLQSVRLQPTRIELTYAWGSEASVRLTTALLPAAERERLRQYARVLADHAAAHPRPSHALTQLLPPLFEFARQRTAQGGDPALENRAALVVLGLVANGLGLETLLPERRDELLARPIRVTLAGRSDSLQHFLTSATLAADAGTELADRVGLFKELADARGGTGFSFNDMAANRAGTRLGALAVGDPARLQRLLSGSLSESDLLPDVSDLPEGLSEREFRRRYGGPGSPAYERLRLDIEERLDTTPLFR